MFTNALNSLLDVQAWVVLLVVGLLVFAEDALFIGFVVPAELVAILGGVAAKEGNVTLTGLLITVIAAAIIGDTVGYEVGKHFGRRILVWRLFAPHRERLDWALDLLARRGGIAVFMGRWIAFFRAVMPALAGISRMPYGRFLAFNAVGGIAWGAVVVMIGYLAGASYDKVETYFGRGIAVVVAVVVVIALIVWQVLKHRKERVSSAER